MESCFLPIGVPIPYPSATLPFGYLKCNGTTFDIKKYPKLALIYPSGILPDLRGEFIRGWDDGPGRTLMSFQTDTIQNIEGVFGRTQLLEHGVQSGAFRQMDTLQSVGLTLSTGSTGYGAPNWSFDASRVVRTANETRPRSVAFSYIVRAQ
ncbi:phage tail protein [Limnobaculum xujianqingii]|uniref:phage tail protein n=1 Tax=Limnobaculum xujianqingii TaxID=2738837 RepID=UPI0011277825|nr:phage tail protein [Limnobaculum xujianqingii]